MTYTLRILDYANTSYKINQDFIYIKTGSIGTNLFITKRDKVIEIQVRGTLL